MLTIRQFATKMSISQEQPPNPRALSAGASADKKILATRRTRPKKALKSFGKAGPRAPKPFWPALFSTGKSEKKPEESG
jgi:hypothetical protein